MVLDINGYKDKFFKDKLVIWDVYSGTVTKNNRIAYCHDDALTIDQSWSILESELSLYPSGNVTIRTKTSPSAPNGNKCKVKWGEGTEMKLGPIRSNSFGMNLKEQMAMMNMMMQPMMNQFQMLQNQQKAMTDMMIQQMNATTQAQIAHIKADNKAHIKAIEHKYEMERLKEELEAAEHPDQYPIIGACERIFPMVAPFILSNNEAVGTASVGIQGLMEGETNDTIENEATTSEKEEKQFTYKYTAKEICNVFAALQKIYPQHNMLDIWNTILEKASDPATKPQVDMVLGMITK